MHGKKLLPVEAGSVVYFTPKQKADRVWIDHIEFGPEQTIVRFYTTDEYDTWMRILPSAKLICYMKGKETRILPMTATERYDLEATDSSPVRGHLFQAFFPAVPSDDIRYIDFIEDASGRRASKLNVYNVRIEPRNRIVY